MITTISLKSKLSMLSIATTTLCVLALILLLSPGAAHARVGDKTSGPIKCYNGFSCAGAVNIVQTGPAAFRYTTTIKSNKAAVTYLEFAIGVGCSATEHANTADATHDCGNGKNVTRVKKKVKLKKGVNRIVVNVKTKYKTQYRTSSGSNVEYATTHRFVGFSDPARRKFIIGDYTTGILGGGHYCRKGTVPAPNSNTLCS